MSCRYATISFFFLNTYKNDHLTNQHQCYQQLHNNVGALLKQHGLLLVLEYVLVYLHYNLLDWVSLWLLHQYSSLKQNLLLPQHLNEKGTGLFMPTDQIFRHVLLRHEISRGPVGVDQVPVGVDEHGIPAVVVLVTLELVTRSVVKAFGKASQHHRGHTRESEENACTPNFKNVKYCLILFPLPIPLLHKTAKNIILQEKSEHTNG